MAEQRTYYYARVSSKSQNLDRQIEQFRSLGAKERDIICDKQSGKDFKRDGYTALKTTLLRQGDTLIITSLDRLGRNKKEMKEELEWMKANHICLRILDIPTSLISVPKGQEWIIDMVNNILIEVLASLAEKERITIRENQKAGIEIAKKKGKYKGRKPVEIDDFSSYYDAWKRRDFTKVALSEKLNISRPTLNKLIKEYEKSLRTDCS